MNQESMEMLLFVGMGLYVMTSVMFFLIFLRTLRTKDGIGLMFLRILSFSLFLGSLVIAFVRFGGLYVDNWNADFGRIIAIINPLTLFGVGLYLNYLFHQKEPKLSDGDTKNIRDIKSDVKKIRSDVSEVKDKVV